MNRNFSFFVVFLLFAGHLQAQYWFGPKVGFQRTDHIYQAANYKTDSFFVDPDYNFQAGFVLTYAASERYSVHTEINFERYSKDLRNRENVTFATSKTNSGFLTVPLMLRFNFGKAPYLFYLNGGTKLSYWLYGNGVMENSFLQEAEDPSKEYQLVFKGNPTAEPDKLVLERPNRLQYALQAGGGMYLDLRNSARIMLDIRYSFGHSNMGFNGSQNFDFEEYVEDFEYRLNSLSVSVGYMFEFNAALQRKGRSTNKQSNRKG